MGKDKSWFKRHEILSGFIIVILVFIGFGLLGAIASEGRDVSSSLDVNDEIDSSTSTISQNIPENKDAYTYKTYKKKVDCPPQVERDFVYIKVEEDIESPTEFSTGKVNEEKMLYDGEGYANCRKGSKNGENVNYIYCSGGYGSNAIADENGIITKSEVFIQFVADLRTCTSVVSGDNSEIKCDYVYLTCGKFDY